MLNAELNLEQWPIHKFVPYAKNPRKNDPNVNRLAGMIREFGFRIPILAQSDGTIIDGHLRLKAAQKLNLKSLPVIVADNMTDSQVKAFRLLVNKSVEWSAWDDELLKIELQELEKDAYELDMTGFSEKEIEKIMGDVGEESADVDFSDELLMEHNYVVLYFDNPFDWEVAKEKFGLKKVRDLIPRKNQPTGIGRVVRGANYLKKIQ